MATRYYIVGGSGTRFTDAEIHTSETCGRAGGPTRPLASSTVETIDSPEWCPECAGGDGSESSDGDGSASEMPEPLPVSDEQRQMERGECPWCDEYEGEHVGRHASRAHPDAWEKYKNETA